MLKSTQLRQVPSIPRAPTAPKPRLPGILHDDAPGKTRQGLIGLAEAAPLLGLSHGALSQCANRGPPGFALITMPDGSREPLKVIVRNHKRLVPAKSVDALVSKRDGIACSTMRLTDVMDTLDITESTMRRHFVRDGGTLYFEVRTPRGRKRFEVKEAGYRTKYMGAADVLEIKRLREGAREPSFEELARDFNPKREYTVPEATLLTSIGKDRIWRMIREGDIEARMVGGHLRIRGAAIQGYFDERKDAPKKLVGIREAAEILGHRDRWITGRLVRRKGKETLEYADDSVSLSIPVYRMGMRRGFPSSELHGLKLIVERVPLRSYLEKHEAGRADYIHRWFSGRGSSHVHDFSVGGLRIEERRCGLITEYKLPEHDIMIAKAGDVVFVKPEDAQMIILAALFRGSDSERNGAISAIEGMGAVPDRYYWLAKAALMTTFGHALVKRLEELIGRHDAKRPGTG
jgi:excisionase family DNA binding protein